MKYLLIFVIFSVTYALIQCASLKTYEQRKAELTKDIQANADFFSSSSSSEERRKLRRMGYRQYCAYYPRKYVCRNPQRYGYPYRYGYGYPYYYTTAPPFPFNLFGKK